MDRVADVDRFGEGDRVEIATRFTGTWAGGFEIASTSVDGCLVRRLNDGAVLPALFDYDNVRLAMPRRRRDEPSPSVTVVRHCDADGSVVLRLAAELDIATVEAIQASVFDAVDKARGEIVLDLDGVRFLDSYGIRLLVAVRRRAWQRDVPFRLRGGRPLIRDLLDFVGLDPLYHAAPATTTTGAPNE